MDIYQIKKLSNEERETLLVGESISVDIQTYHIPCDQAELTIVKDELSKASVQRSFIEEEFKTVKESFKERLSPIQEMISESIATLKTGTKTVNGKVYLLPDFENKMMHSIDQAGNVLNSRPMKPEERQFRIEHISKAV